MERQNIFRKHFEGFISERINEHYYETVKKNPEYLDYLHKLDELGKTIVNLYGRDLFDEYDQLMMLSLSIQVDTAYTIGMRDGLRLKHLLGVPAEDEEAKEA